MRGRSTAGSASALQWGRAGALEASRVIGKGHRPYTWHPVHLDVPGGTSWPGLGLEVQWALLLPAGLADPPTALCVSSTETDGPERQNPGSGKTSGCGPSSGARSWVTLGQQLDLPVPQFPCL